MSAVERIREGFPYARNTARTALYPDRSNYCGGRGRPALAAVGEAVVRLYAANKRVDIAPIDLRL
jgi:hypothetical protein